MVAQSKTFEVTPEWIEEYKNAKTSTEKRIQLETRLKVRGWSTFGIALQCLHFCLFVCQGIVTVVNDVESAQRVLEIIENNKDRYFAVDVEAVEVDLKKVGPVGNGRIICWSFFCGDDVDFGNGPRVWVDNTNEASNLLQAFAPFLSNPGMACVRG